MNELVEKISMWRNELERQSAHQGIDMVFDSICVYLGEQHRIYEKVRNSLCSSNRERVEERDQLLEDIQLYKELFIVANSKNMAYTMALKENIPILKSVLQVIKNQVEYDEGITLGGVIVQLEKALEVDTNESKQTI